MFSIKSKGAGFLNFDRSRLKILPLEQILQRLPIALSQVNAGNNSKNLLHEIRQIVYSWYQSKNQNKSPKKNTIT